MKNRLKVVWSVAVWISVVAWLFSVFCHAFGAEVWPAAPIVITLVYSVATAQTIISGWDLKRFALVFLSVSIYVVSWMVLADFGRLAAVLVSLAGLAFWCRGILHEAMLPKWVRARVV
jgi:hypothetical protein